jgi:hypothetical protein
MPSLAFFNLAKCGAKLRTKAQNNPGAPGLFCHRIHAMTPPAEFFNGLLGGHFTAFFCPAVPCAAATPYPPWTKG